MQVKALSPYSTYASTAASSAETGPYGPSSSFEDVGGFTMKGGGRPSPRVPRIHRAVGEDETLLQLARGVPLTDEERPVRPFRRVNLLNVT